MVNRPLATLLRAYQLDAGYTPGPLFLLAVVAGLLGSLGVLRRRAAPARRGAATACLVTFLAAVGVLLGSDVFALPLSSATSRRAGPARPGNRFSLRRRGRRPCSVAANLASRRRTARRPVKLPEGARR